MRILGMTALGAMLGLAMMPAAHVSFAQSDSGWITLVDANKMGEWTRVAEANWEMKDGALVADKAADPKVPAYLVSKDSYKDFQIRAEFWTDEAANSGIFIRCESTTTIDSKVCYEVNIFDKRPDPTYGTGAIVDVAKVDPMPKAGGKWNVMEITAEGPHLVVTLNGEKTADVQNSAHASGPIALQYGSGVVKFRKVQIRKL